MKNLKKKKLYFQVYDELKEYIIKNSLKPGDKLPTEKEMTELLGVSRNVLREAIKTFEIIGVLTSKPGVGIILNKFDSNFLSTCIFLNLITDDINLVEQSQQVRKVLELGFARQSFDLITDERIKEMEAIIDEMKIVKNETQFYGLDEKFHITMLKNDTNLVLEAFIESAWACDKAYRATLVHDDPDLRIKKHTQILDALKEHNFDKFIEALNYHFSYKFKLDIDK